jgi:aspartyl protease family protein
MRSILWFVTIFMAVGAFVAHYADKVIVNPNPKSVNAEAASRVASSSEATRIVTVLPPERSPSASPQVPSKPSLPQVIVLSPSSSSGRTVTLREDGRGHYQTEARVDGVKVNFLVDTGATAVMLSPATATKLGIRLARSDYTAKVITGNGEVSAAVVQLNKIELGEITVRDVRALVFSDDKTAIDLLGMTFLSRVRWTHDRGQLIIEQLSNN